MGNRKNVRLGGSLEAVEREKDSSSKGFERESANGRFRLFFFFLSFFFLSNRVDLKRAPHLCTSWTVYNARALRTAMRLCCEKRVNLEFGSGPLVFSKKSSSAGLSLSQIFVCLLFVSFLVLARVSTMYSFPNLVEGEEEREREMERERVRRRERKRRREKKERKGQSLPTPPFSFPPPFSFLTSLLLPSLPLPLLVAFIASPRRTS